ncbi:uncharacterized protein PV07_04720 [Cladophialophora immunda]|uniref:Uncharacterized protein n=1 Tax=Cladophialophora immunda TaxID=569365 RepID=A0A0D2AUE5_9EURO|nr:uncharacterized protein PV07_04720 [Cladophialophora immunda]KIW28857.1 hypothetical protein PV07_04720 [Cladophialophora immunda]
MTRWLDYSISQKAGQTQLPQGFIRSSGLQQTILTNISNLSLTDRDVVTKGGRLDKLLSILLMYHGEFRGPETERCIYSMKSLLYGWVNTLDAKDNEQNRWIWQIKPALYEGEVAISVKGDRVSADGSYIDGTLGSWIMTDEENGFLSILGSPDTVYLFRIEDLVSNGDLVKIKNWQEQPWATGGQNTHTHTQS